MSCNISYLMEDYSKLFTQELYNILPKVDHNDILLTSMRYSLSTPGKHIRPFLVNTSAQIFNVNIGRALPISIAVELIHVYSLIHDDLPSIDNEDIRRGELSSHKKFTEAIAILTGDALLTLAFEILSTMNESPYIRCRIIQLLTQTIGYQGMIKGQVLDTETVAKDINDIKTMHTLKTARLFSTACELGGILGGASDSELNSLRNYGLNLGSAFQIKDDTADICQDKSKNNILNILSKEDTENYMNSLIDKSIEYLAIFQIKQIF